MPTFRKIRHRLAKSPVRAPLVWLRHLRFTPADAFIGSYPRSGSTWLRFMLAEILVRESSGFSNVNRTIPDVGDHTSALPILPRGGRLIKTHEPYRREYRKAIYLVRDPRDVVLSEFAYQKALGLADDDFGKYLGRFLRGEVNPFGSWCNHVHSWITASDRGRAEVLLVYFEELRRSCDEQLANLLDFLAVPVQGDVIRRAVANNSVENMRAKEKINPQRASAKGRFIRSGSVGAWRDKFTDAQAQLVQQYAGEAIARLKYPAIQCVERELA